MTINLRDLLAHTPGVQAFVRQLIEDIANSRSIVVFLPTTVDSDWLWSLVRGQLWHRQFGIEEVVVPSLTDRDGPAAYLGDALRVTWPSSSDRRDMITVFASEHLPEVILLNGLEDLDGSAQKVWLNFIRQWAQLSQNQLNQSSALPVLCVILRWAHLSLPIALESDVRLAVHWWWSLPSSLESKLLFRIAGVSRSQKRTEVQWQEHLLPSLASGDVTLIERLWDRKIADAEDIVLCLAELAREREWTAEKLREWGANDLLNSRIHLHRYLPEAPPGRARALWAHGAACATEEYGLELHPSALYALGLDRELQHRLWRGQSELLLPILDAIRLDVCSYLTHYYGDDWPLKWSEPDHPDEAAALRESPLACGWGYLEWLVRNCPALSRERRWISFISSAAHIRNAMAHYRTVSRSHYEQLVDQHQRFIQMTFG